MVQNSAIQKIKNAETDIAVLQAQYNYLTEKIDDVKTGLKDLESHIDNNMSKTNALIVTFQAENEKQHGELNKKVAALEKWRWMIIGAGTLAGALGWPALASLFNM